MSPSPAVVEQIHDNLETLRRLLDEFRVELDAATRNTAELRTALDRGDHDRT